MKQIIYFFSMLFLLATSCKNNSSQTDQSPSHPVGSQELTIYFVNDLHAQLKNFAKIKYIVDSARQNSNVILACSGDIFSGDPVVDQYEDKGYPVVDLMNRCGFDIAELGNHEFDYGQAALAARMAEAEFAWICANADFSASEIPQVPAYKTFLSDSLRVSFLGLVETYGKPGSILPSTHPWRVDNVTFTLPEEAVQNYSNLKTSEDADLYIALSHLGFSYESVMGDAQMAQNYPYFDVIIGAHSHQIIDTTINNIPIFQAGSYLHLLGKITMTITDRAIDSIRYEMVNLDSYPHEDPELQELIASYQEAPFLEEVIGNAATDMDKSNVGCFYTDALCVQLQADLSLQNTGGVRSSLNAGEITRGEIYKIAPFNNGTVIYTYTAKQIKDFLKGSQAGFFYSGISLSQEGDEIIMHDAEGHNIADDTELKLALNDYIPAVHESYFPEQGDVQDLTAANTIIQYLTETNANISYSNCDHYFRYE